MSKLFNGSPYIFRQNASCSHPLAGPAPSLAPPLPWPHPLPGPAFPLVPPILPAHLSPGGVSHLVPLYYTCHGSSGTSGHAEAAGANSRVLQGKAGISAPTLVVLGEPCGSLRSNFLTHGREAGTSPPPGLAPTSPASSSVRHRIHSVVQPRSTQGSQPSLLSSLP